MFTGIVEAKGMITDVQSTDQGRVFTIRAPRVAGDIKIGDSIAINGTCLTAVRVGSESFVVEAVSETLAKTSLGGLADGVEVNLERPMAAAGRFDGHIVQGHVDGTGTVTAIEPEGAGARLTVAFSPDLARYIVPKGSVTVDGVSLTVAELDEGAFQIAVIPHTLDVTVLGDRRPGDLVNLEVDVIAKYVERMIKERP